MQCDHFDCELLLEFVYFVFMVYTSKPLDLDYVKLRLLKLVSNYINMNEQKKRNPPGYRCPATSQFYIVYYKYGWMFCTALSRADGIKFIGSTFFIKWIVHVNEEKNNNNKKLPFSCGISCFPSKLPHSVSARVCVCEFEHWMCCYSICTLRPNLYSK